MWEIVWLMAPAGGEGKGGGGFMSLLPFVIIIVIFYLLLIRPQAKRQRETQKMLQSVKKGDKIVTSGGVHGDVVGIKDNKNTLIVKIADNVKIELDRSSVGRRLSLADEEDEQVGKTK